ncbi:MAG: helix-turn-helix domain-containing protein [Muribaculum sp.]|nr:helix-turn-helix domain-containing protein [Muribaculum sp.]
MTSTEFRMISQLIAELREDIRNHRDDIDRKIDSVTRSVKDAFQGFGILDPEEEVWTEKQVCEKYHKSRKTMFNYRKEGKIPYHRIGVGKNSSVRYRKADVMDFFATENA